MSLKESLIQAQIESMLKKQRERLVELEATNDSDNALNVDLIHTFDYNGKTYYYSVYTEDDLGLSNCCSDEVTYFLPPKYKFWYKDHKGDYIFIKAKNVETAQEVVAAMTGTRVGHYKVSSNKI